MSKIIKIYCEGKKGSHDYDIIEKVIGDLSIVIEPIGSIRGASAIIQYKELGVEKSDFKMLFRDRDFDREIPKKVYLEKDDDKPYIYYSYRNTIENYLFNPSDLYKFLVKEKLVNKYQIFSETDAKQKLIDAAENIRNYQAVRHTMGKMRTDKTNFGTKWTEKSGDLPEKLDLIFCKTQAFKKIEEASEYTKHWNKTEFDKISDDFLEKFNQDFMNNLDFLVWFQGKDLETSFKNILPEFPLKSYYKFAKTHFDYTQFPDLVELHTLLQNKLQ